MLTQPPTPGPATLSQQQLYELCVIQGQPQKIAVTLATIAWRESRGVPTVHNVVPPDDSYGLWQINLLNADVANFVYDRFPSIKANPAQLFDPILNCQVAVALYRGVRSYLDLLWRIDSPGAPRDAFLKFLPEAHLAALASKL